METIRFLDAQEWARLWGGPGALTLPQAPAYGRMAEAAGARVLRALWRGRLGAQVLRRGPLAVLHRGPLALEGDLCAQEARAFCAALARAVFPAALLVQPEAPLRIGLPLLTARHHAIWDIGAPGLRGRMGQKWRNRLHAAERGGLEVRPAGTAGLARLAAAVDAQRAARGYRGLPAGTVAAFAAAGGGTLVLEARREGAVVAGLACLLHGEGATYQIGWSGPEGRAAQAATLLLARAAETLAARGLRTLDLGEASRAHPGLARFKLGTGAALVPLGPLGLVPPLAIARHAPFSRARGASYPAGISAAAPGRPGAQTGADA